MTIGLERNNLMHEPILHHYWGSPYAEKVRSLFGYKKLSWRSCEIPVTPPRSNLARIFGGFRRTPILQLGADFICDTRLIAEVIESLAPEPSLAPKQNEALSQLICYWAEPRVFALVGPARFRNAEDVEGIFDGKVTLDQFRSDRMPFMHPVYDAARFGRLNASAWDHLNRYMETLESFFAAGPRFIGGDRPAFGDFSAYHTVWWLRAPPAQTEFLSCYPAIAGWADRMAAIGHGSYRNIDDDSALATAIAAKHEERRFSSPWQEQQDRRMGREVEIVPDDYGKDPVDGTIVAMSSRHVTIEREAVDIGMVRVHYPRVGYEIVTKSAATGRSQPRND
jgi:glutathione S-transferase